MTVLEVIRRSSDFLAGKRVESPRLQVELLLAHLLQLPRLKLYLNFERALTKNELDQLREMVKRRGEREPLQHIIGSTSFCGLEFMVNRDVLIPRPETELLAERAWGELEKISSSLGEKNSPLVLDLGTGSGCLAVTLATKAPSAKIHATDGSSAALQIARSNAERHGVAERIFFHETDLFPAKHPEPFYLIVTNPPYIPTDTIETLEPEVRDFDPRAALDGGRDGLDFYRRLALEAFPHLALGGKLLAEFGDDQSEPVAKIFTKAGWTIEEIIPDLSGKPRIIIARGANC